MPTVSLLSNNRWLRARVWAMVAIIAAPFACAAVTITGGPTFSPTSAAPLAGVLHINTDVPTRVSVSVMDRTNTWQRDFLDYTNVHSTTLLGFKPGRSNLITVTVYDKHRSAATAPNPVTFVTAALPITFPKLTTLVSKPDKMEPGYTLFRGLNVGSLNYVIIVDNLGEVVWYGTPSIVQDVRQLANGDLFIPLVTSMNEVNMLGQVVQTWIAPTSWPINNHDGVPTPHGTILYLSDASVIVTNFPTSATVSNAPTKTTNVWYQMVIEMSATNSSFITNWSTIAMLDPRRISYLTFSAQGPKGWDWGHANAVIEDPSDSSLIVSLRHQNAVIKFARAGGRLKWILGPHENFGAQFQPFLLNPVGTPFAWNYAQHAPKITPQGTILMYDDGDYRASPFATWVPDQINHSRAVEYSINEDTKEISQVWEYTSTNEPLYTFAVGDADYLPKKDNVLVTYGLVSYVNGVHPSLYSTNATMVRIKEVTHEANPEVVFDLALFDYSNTTTNYKGCQVYRSDRIPDLYSVLPQPVTDLLATCTNGQAHLSFSGNDTWTYLVEASTNLLDWDQIGFVEPSGNADYDFEDPQADEFPARYYRVVTQ